METPNSSANPSPSTRVKPTSSVESPTTASVEPSSSVATALGKDLFRQQAKYGHHNDAAKKSKQGGFLHGIHLYCMSCGALEELRVFLGLQIPFYA